MGTKKHIKRSSWAMLAEIIAAVAVCYFLLEGRAWSPVAWAAFAIVAGWIIIMNVRLEVGLETEKSYWRWKQQIGLLMVVALLVSRLWINSWWPFIIGLILGVVWLDDLRHIRSRHRNDSHLPPSK